MGAQTEASGAANTLSCQIAVMHMTAADAVVLIDAITAALTASNGHLPLHREAVRELDVLSIWMQQELDEQAAQNEPVLEAA